MTDPAAGALVAFEGRVRNHNEGNTVVALEYQAYGPMAEREGADLLSEAMKTFGIRDARCVHRTGRLEVGDVAVWIGVTASHRDDAFKACRFIIDELKRRVPIWKREHFAEGSSAWLDTPGG
jgi:molybdopterin synthase catalytic subunit